MRVQGLIEDWKVSKLFTLFSLSYSVFISGRTDRETETRNFIRVLGFRQRALTIEKLSKCIIFTYGTQTASSSTSYTRDQTQCCCSECFLYTRRLSTMFEIWGGNMLGKPHRKCPSGCSLKTPNLHRLWIAQSKEDSQVGALPNPRIDTRSPLWKAKIAHKTIVSPLFIPNPVTNISEDFTISPCWLW